MRKTVLGTIAMLAVTMVALCNMAQATQSITINGSTFQTVRLNPSTYSVDLALAQNSVHTQLPTTQLLQEYTAQTGNTVTAAINGMFFNAYYDSSAPMTFPENCPIIVNNLIQDGQMIRGNLGASNAFIFTTEGVALADHADFQPIAYAGDKGMLSIWTVNGHNTSPNAVVLITEAVTLPYTPMAGARVYLLQNDIVAEELTGGQSIQLHQGQKLLSIHSGAIDFYSTRDRLPQVGDVMRFETNLIGADGQAIANPDTVLGGGRMLVCDGKNVVADATYNGNITDPMQDVASRHLRSFIAVMNNGEVMLGTGTGSFGDIAAALVSQGAVGAMSLDGGGSSMLQEKGNLCTTATRDLTNILVFSEQASPATTPTTSTNSALANHMTTMVDHNLVDMPAYNINGNNYVKLRDLAYTLRDTARPFAVAWNATNNSVALTSDVAYQAVGGEMEHSKGTAAAFTPSQSVVTINGTALPLTAYNIDGNNYVKLRDLGQAFNFSVGWDAAQSLVVLQTDRPYET